ncbi:MAG: DUF2066 domain-containing protein [Gammaproteobacteria bacterium]|nr:DUF2066 domain-containing protein [Gammaproteobacteria bacterium]
MLADWLHGLRGWMMGSGTTGMAATALALLALALPAPSFAAADPYQVSVPVPDQSAGARRSAEREALTRVLIRLSGDPEVARRQELAGALRAAQNYFVRSGYARIRDPELAEAHPEARWLLELEADRSGILRLLRESDIPAWTGRRPEVLVLILREEPDGERLILDPRSEEARTLVRAGRDRGLPLTVPLMDLPDQLALDAGALWARFEDATAPLQQRYQPDAILMLRLYPDALGRWVADWEGQVGGELFAAAVEVPEPVSAAGLLVDRLSARLTARYALRLGGDADSLWLQVDQLSEVGAYAGLMRYLAGVSGVSRVQLVQVRDHSLLLRLDSSDDAERLLDLLRLEARLQPDTTPEQVGDVAVWRARWRQEG